MVVRRERRTRRDAVLFCIVKIWRRHPYISVIMGAEDKAFLYQEMNRLLEAEKHFLNDIIQKVSF